MGDANLRDKSPIDAVVRSPTSHMPTTGPPPIPGGEYDRDGCLYRCHVEHNRHERPDFVLEIISPRSGERDTREKPSRYEAVGIPEYWVFDPHRRWLPNGLHGRLLVGRQGGGRGGRKRKSSACEPVSPEPGFAPFWGTSCYELKHNLPVNGHSVYDSSLL